MPSLLKPLSTVSDGLPMSTPRTLFLSFAFILSGCGGGGSSATSTTEAPESTYLDESNSNIHITAGNLNGSLELGVTSEAYSTVMTIDSGLAYLNADITSGDTYFLEIVKSPQNQICEVTGGDQITITDGVLRVGILCFPAHWLTITTFDIPGTVTVKLDTGEIAEIPSGVEDFTFNSKFHNLKSNEEGISIIDTPEGYGCAINELTATAYFKDTERPERELYCFPLNKRIIEVSSNLGAFSVLREDGRVFVWGNSGSGGDATFYLRDLKNVRSLSEAPYRKGLSFTVIYENGSILSYGGSEVIGADSYSVEHLLTNTDRVFHNGFSNIGLTTDNRLVGWGSELYGGDTRLHLSSSLRTMHQNIGAYAALLENGDVVTFGSSIFGGEVSSSLQSSLMNVKDITASDTGFAALKQDGSVITWPEDSGVNSPDVDDLPRLTNVKKIVYGRNFVAIREDGELVVWPTLVGDVLYVDGKYATQEDLLEMQENVVDVVANQSAYAVIFENRSVKAFGLNDFGADDEGVASELVNVKSVFALNNTVSGAFAALRYDGTVVTWGMGPAANSASVASDLVNVEKIFHNDYAFAAIRSDGSVVTWGDNARGGDSSAVQSDLIGVQKIYATDEAFAALKNDGSVVTWGNPRDGGDSSHLAQQLNRL